MLMSNTIYSGIIAQLFIAEIHQSPQTTTVFVNTNATFSCQASNFDYMVWLINGTNRNSNPEALSNTWVSQPNADNLITTLTIIGYTHYNGTQVQCKAVQTESGNVTESEIATLYVQGEGVLNEAARFKILPDLELAYVATPNFGPTRQQNFAPNVVMSTFVVMSIYLPVPTAVNILLTYKL